MKLRKLSEFEVVDIKPPSPPPLPRVDIGISLVINTVRVLWIFYRMYSKFFTNRILHLYCILFRGLNEDGPLSPK